MIIASVLLAVTGTAGIIASMAADILVRAGRISRRWERRADVAALVSFTLMTVGYSLADSRTWAFISLAGVVLSLLSFLDPRWRKKHD